LEDTTIYIYGDVANKKITISNRLKQQFAAGDNTKMTSGKSGGKQQISVSEVSDSTPLIVYLDGQVVNKSVQRRLLRFSDAAK
jgi:hypothetical protein